MGDLMKKHEMTEEDIKLQFITPAIEGAGINLSKLKWSTTSRTVVLSSVVMLLPEAKESALTICSTTSPIFHWLSSRRKITGTALEPGCSRPSNMPKCWTFRLCTARMATVSWNTI